MTVEEINTFIMVVETNSITAAANQLFISQSTASSRIHNLEKEIGVSLIYRAKGIKEISLTTEGEEFLPIAQQWLALYKDAQNLKNYHSLRTLRIVTSDLLNTQLLPYIYTDFTNKYNNIMLYTQTEHASEAYNQVANQLIDIAIVYTLHNLQNIVSYPLYKENMVILCHKDHKFAKTQDFRDLNGDSEVYTRWSTEYEVWHKQNFPYNHRFKIVIGTASMTKHFLNETTDWAIVPKIVANNIILEKADFIAIEHSYIPSRTAYLLTHKYAKPGSKELIQLFINELVGHLKKNDSVTML